MAQSPGSNSAMRTQVTGRMPSPSTSIIAAVTFSINCSFCSGVKTGDHRFACVHRTLTCAKSDGCRTFTTVCAARWK